MDNCKEIFEDIYKYQKWGYNNGTLSGPGSTVSVTTQLRKDLQCLCKEYDIKTFIDAPCGDCTFTSQIPWSDLGINYVGCDIVSDLIVANQSKIPTGKFYHLDITKDKLPEGDVIMVRDCLFHLSYDLIKQALTNIYNSNIKYLLSTTFLDHKTNKDIVTGGWRTINLETSPFNLPPPMIYLQDYYPDRQFHDKRLAVWKINELYHNHASKK